ncbi:MAG: glycosyltransferase family 9 protein [Puniceicoccales bacterium]|jgi:ADP-heptose:LPS heptosyltransferase|nr:glycosyltransferase family 9 protein [Puniceicoccales bacterium]
MKKPQRLLVVKPSSLGDVVQALQVVAALKQQRPDLAVDWVVRDCFAEIVQNSGLVDRVFPFHRSLLGLLSCCRAIHFSEKFFAVWDMQGLLRSGLMTMAAHAGRKIGRSDARELAGLFCRETVPLPKKHPPHHAVEILMEFLPSLGLERAIANLTFTPVASAFAIASPYVLIAPESRVAAKVWPHHRALTDHLCRCHPRWTFVWIGQGRGGGTPQRSNFLDLRGRTSLSQLPALVQNSLGVVANDSGCGHLAAALGRPNLTLFMETDSARFAPYPPGGIGHFVAHNPPPLFVELEQFSNFLQKLAPR